MAKIVVWFSCGNNSAVASLLTLDKYMLDDVRIIRCVVPNEHIDNDRFHADIERWINYPIERRGSTEYKDCWEVWERRKYISGIRGAPCTLEMKKAVRWAVEREWHPDFQVFGFSSDEKKRSDDFAERNPEVRMLSPLIDAGITKPMCAEFIAAAGITMAEMYKLGFSNNNCICCVKATSIFYWARSRHYFPVEFARISELSRRLGCRLTRIKGKRIFLDEMPVDIDWQKKDKSKQVVCGIGCG
jgi:hypothetical protein